MVLAQQCSNIFSTYIMPLVGKYMKPGFCRSCTKSGHVSWSADSKCAIQFHVRQFVMQLCNMLCKVFVASFWNILQQGTRWNACHWFLLISRNAMSKIISLPIVRGVVVYCNYYRVPVSWSCHFRKRTKNFFPDVCLDIACLAVYDSWLNVAMFLWFHP